MKDHMKKGILRKVPLNPSKYCPFCGAASEAKTEKGEDGKPALIVKQAKRNYYNVITLEALERQVLKVLKADKDRV